MLFLTTTHSNNCAERWNLITTATCSLVLTFYLTLHWRLTWWVRLFMFRKRSIQWPGVKMRKKGRHFLHPKHFTSWSNFSIFFISEINRSPSMNAKPFSIERYVKLIKSITKKGTIKKYIQSFFFMVSWNQSNPQSCQATFGVRNLQYCWTSSSTWPRLRASGNIKHLKNLKLIVIIINIGLHPPHGLLSKRQVVSYHQPKERNTTFNTYNT